MIQYSNEHHSGIPILGRYIDSWRFAFSDKTDGLGKARLNVLLGNYSLTLISAVTAGIFYTQLFLMMFAEVPEETRVLTQNNYTSIINGLASAAGFLQLLSPFVFERLKKRKTLIFTFYGIYHFLDIVLLPACLFLPFDVITRANIFVVIMTLRTALTALASPGFSAWHIASLSDFCRSDYYMISNALGSIITPILNFVLGLYLDAFVDNGRALFGILLIRGLALGLVAMEFFTFNKVPEPEYNTGLEMKQDKPTFGEILTAPFRCKPFLVIVGIVAFRSLLVGLSPYYGTYLRDGAHLSYTYINLVSLAGVPCSILMLPFWNKMVHKYGWLPVLSVSLGLFSICYGINALVTEETKWMYFVSNIYCQIVCGGQTIAMGNLVFLRLPESLRTGCLAFYSAVSSLIGILAAGLAQVIQSATNGKILYVFGLALENRAYMSFLPFAGELISAILIALLAWHDKKKGILQIPGKE